MTIDIFYWHGFVQMPSEFFFYWIFKTDHTQDLTLSVTRNVTMVECVMRADGVCVPRATLVHTVMLLSATLAVWTVVLALPLDAALVPQALMVGTVKEVRE